MTYLYVVAKKQEIEKYGLNEIWAKYHGFGEVLPGFEYRLVLDRDQDSFLLLVAVGREGREGHSTFVFYLSGVEHEITLIVSKAGRGIEWHAPAESGLGKINHFSVDALKEALAIYSSSLEPSGVALVTFDF